MEKLESLNPNKSRKALKVLKFIIVVFLLPFIFSITAAFIKESNSIKKEVLNPFIWGIISFLVFYLFIYEPSNIYKKGQKITEATFRFISPLVRFAPFVLPIYSILIFALYCLIFRFTSSNLHLGLFMFLIGFSIIFHLVFSAKILHSRKDDFLMINYLFSFGFIYIINITLLALGFSIIFESFSWINFGKTSLDITRYIFSVLITQLFL